MTELEQYQEKFKKLSDLKADLVVQLNVEKSKAADLKENLKKLGYASLDEAKDDYVKRMASLKDKEKELDQLLEKVENFKVTQLSKDKVSENLAKEYVSRKDTEQEKHKNVEETEKDTIKEANLGEDKHQETNKQNNQKLQENVFSDLDITDLV